MVGVAVQLVPAPLLRGAPPDVAQNRPRELELVVAPPPPPPGRISCAPTSTGPRATVTPTAPAWPWSPYP